MKNRRKYIYFIAAVVILGLVIYVVPSVTGLFETTEVIESGTLQVSESTTCYFVRNEKVYTAASGGEIHYLVKEGEKVRKKTKVAQFNEDGRKLEEGEESEYQDLMPYIKGLTVPTEMFRTGSSGVISFYIDENENAFTTGNMKNLKYYEVSDMDFEETSIKRSAAFKGEPLYKLVDDSRWYFVFWTASENISRYEKGNPLTLIVDDGEIDATINSVDEDGDMWRIIAYSSNYYKDLPRYISRDAMVISSRSSGLIIDNECMTTRKGKPGVMVRQKTGDYKFVPVNVEASDGVQSVVSDTYFINEKKKMVNTVEIYDEILKDPGEGN